MVTTSSNTKGAPLGTHDAPATTDESSRLVHGFVPTRYELAVIALHYLDAIPANGRGNEAETGGSTESASPLSPWKGLRPLGISWAGMNFAGRSRPSGRRGTRCLR